MTKVHSDSSNIEDIEKNELAYKYLIKIKGLLKAAKVNEAVSCGQSALVRLKELGQEEFLCQIYFCLGIGYFYQADEHDAIESYFAAIKQAEKRHDDIMLVNSYFCIASHYISLKAYDKAIELLTYAYSRIECKIEKNEQFWQIKEYYDICMAFIKFYQKKYQEAYEHIRQIEESSDLIPRKVECRNVLKARILHELGEYEQCSRYIHEFRKLETDWKDQLEQYECYRGLIMLELERADYEDAFKDIQKLSKIVEIMQIPSSSQKLCELKAEYASKVGDEELLYQAMEEFFDWDQYQVSKLNFERISCIEEKFALQQARNDARKNAEKSFLLNSRLQYDELTKAANRYGLTRYYKQQYKLAKQERMNFGILMIDVDYFKQYNDTYGHLEGDQCLKKISSAIAKACVNKGFIARYGGDEFLVVTTDLSNEELGELVQVIQKNIRKLQIPNVKSKVSEQITVSIGAVNGIPEDSIDVMDYIHMADSSLYRIKKTTRNGCCFAEGAN